YAAGSAAAGMDLGNYINNNILQPLGMYRSGFAPNLSNCAPTSPDENQSEILRCVPQDRLARDFGGFNGAAGLFATGEDVSKFTRTLIGGRLLPPHDLQMLTSHVDGLYSTGMMINADGRFGNLMSRQTIGHIGANGTGVFGDPVSGLWSVIL